MCRLLKIKQKNYTHNGSLVLFDQRENAAVVLTQNYITLTTLVSNGFLFLMRQIVNAFQSTFLNNV